MEELGWDRTLFLRHPPPSLSSISPLKAFLAKEKSTIVEAVEIAVSDFESVLVGRGTARKATQTQTGWAMLGRKLHRKGICPSWGGT